jgi:hypothetical protein
MLVILPSVTLDKEILLSSVKVITLDKEATFAECLLVHSTKDLTKRSAGDPLPSASSTSTRQRGSLCRMPPNTFSKGTGKGAHGELVCRVSV